MALSTEALAAQGITYPWHISVEAARKGYITSGNIESDLIVETYDQACLTHPQASRFLFSNEVLTSRLLRSTQPLETLIKRGVSVALILFIRNPLSHAISLYGQSVKRGGQTGDIDEHLASYRMPEAITHFLKWQRDAGVKVHIANYSRHAHDPGLVFCDLLELRRNTLSLSPVSTVNRSLTPSELYLQRAFNRGWGKGSNVFVSDRLCNKLPEIFVPPPTLSQRQYDAFCDRVGPMIEAANQIIPSSEAYQLEPYDMFSGHHPETGDIRFSTAQVDVLADAIAARIPPSHLTDAFFDLVEALRDGRAVEEKDITLLIEMARALRPGTKRFKRPSKPSRCFDSQ
ncbi:hypothetical protein KZZ08_02735 [Roseovarius mucosus]|uniref:hypothetical protein n=1 Tax=Roseovarius mucosus TaxID=215743 RepID=UPI001C5E7C34|nr:hypothetical protein [Roseovarius mucosus]MBW4972514.1 hypothetical protein [Roseovarius mucosus]